MPKTYECDWGSIRTMTPSRLYIPEVPVSEVDRATLACMQVTGRAHTLQITQHKLPPRVSNHEVSEGVDRHCEWACGRGPTIVVPSEFLNGRVSRSTMQIGSGKKMDEWQSCRRMRGIPTPQRLQNSEDCIVRIEPKS